MYKEFSDEVWTKVDNIIFKQRIEHCLDDVNHNNRFSVDEIYRISDLPYALSEYYIVVIKCDRNDNVTWIDYTKDIHKIFKALYDKNKCHFLRAWLIKLNNNMNDRFEMLIGLRDEEVRYPPSISLIMKK